MTPLSLLRKEVLWSRHNLVTLLVLLLLLPGAFAYTSVAFQHVIPEDAPVALVAQDDTVTEDDLDIVRGGVTLFADPEVYDTRAGALDALRREAVYAVVEVPPRLTDETQDDATFYLYVEGSMVPFEEPSKAIRSIMNFYLGNNLPAEVTVEREVVGGDHTLSEYLVPVFLMGILMLFAFAYVPYNLAREADVLERLRAEASMDAVVATKLGYFTALMLVPILAFEAATAYLGYALDLLAPAAVGVYLLTFLYLAAVSTSVMILTKFSALGRFVNAALLFGLFVVSSLVYPVGFFSPLRREVARLVPLHYSMIVARSAAMKETPMGLYADWLLGLVAVAVVSGVVLKLSIVHYRRTV